MSDINIREAAIEDVDSLLVLEQGIIDSERPYDRFLKENNVTYYDFPELISDADSYLMVVESNDRIVGSGYAQARVSRPCHVHDQHCYLGFIYLEPEFRGRGLGASIVEDLKQWGLNRGLSHFHLNVYSDNKSAIRAYEKAGFSQVTGLMELVV